MNPAHVRDTQIDGVRSIALDQPSVAVTQPDDAQAVIDRFDRGGGDDPIDSGRRTAADQNRQNRKTVAHRKPPALFLNYHARRDERILRLQPIFIRHSGAYPPSSVVQADLISPALIAA